MSRRHDKLAYLTYLGLLMCLPLTSCSRVTAKADVAAIEAVPVRTVRAVSQDVPLEISAVGNVEAMESVAVKSRIAGQINRVAFEEGQNVNKGQLLSRSIEMCSNVRRSNNRPSYNATLPWNNRLAQLWREMLLHKNRASRKPMSR